MAKAMRSKKIDIHLKQSEKEAKTALEVNYDVRTFISLYTCRTEKEKLSLNAIRYEESLRHLW